MSVTLTERAAQEVSRIMGGQSLPEGTGLRLAISGGGCSGFTYKLGFDNEVGEFDETEEQHGITLIVDKKSALYLSGTEVDYHDDLDNKGFVFSNPNAKRSCGCGSSFSV
jgi:iron-sulfur cluster assembly protein